MILCTYKHILAVASGERVKGKVDRKAKVHEDYGEIFNGCVIDHNALLASLGMTGRDYILEIKSKVTCQH